jgi:hypothetical protein
MNFAFLGMMGYNHPELNEAGLPGEEEEVGHDTGARKR